MRKLFTVLLAATLLTLAAWAQTPRRHTRPPYSGPKMNQGKGRLPKLRHARPSAHRAGFSPKGKAAHILVR